jgi:hypothetical protein
MEAKMRKYPYKLAVEDRQIVWGWCRRMLAGYVAFAIVLLLATLAFRADHNSHEQAVDDAVARFDHFGIDELAISLAPPPQAIRPDAAGEQKPPLKDAGLDPKRAR